MSNKESNFKEKLRLALASTIRVISDDLETKRKSDDNKSSKKFDFFELDNLNSKNDFIKARAEADSSALKKNFQTTQYIKKIFQTILVVSLCTQLLKKQDMKP